MHSTNYFDTFIEVAEDCPVDVAEVPPAKVDAPTVASLQFEMIAQQPYAHTSDDVIFAVHARRNNLKATAAARAEFFAKGQPCLRASPLTKRYGYGIHSDAQGRVALVPVESPEYRRMAADKALKHLKAMRSARKT